MDQLLLPGYSRPQPTRYAVFDVETRHSAAEVGGWHKLDKMGVSIVVLYDSATDAFTAYEQEQIPDMVTLLQEMDLVIGFNSIRFDYPVLAPHAGAVVLEKLPTLDILHEVAQALSFRVSLDALASATLGAKKSASGLQALTWWQEGRLDLITEYCRQDVALTRDLYLYGQEHQKLFYFAKNGQKCSVSVPW